MIFVRFSAVKTIIFHRKGTVGFRMLWRVKVYLTASDAPESLQERSHHALHPSPSAGGTAARCSKTRRGDNKVDFERYVIVSVPAHSKDIHWNANTIRRRRDIKNITEQIPRHRVRLSVKRRERWIALHRLPPQVNGVFRFPRDER